MRILDVEPIGSETSNAFWDGTDENGNHIGGFGPIERPVYPASPNGKRLRQRRIDLGMTLREAADKLGCRPSEVSGLEFGRNTVDDWDALFAKLERLTPPGRGGEER